MKKNRNLEGLTREQALQLLLEQDQQIAALEKEAKALQQEQAELSTRLAYLDEIKEENLRLLLGRNLL